MHRQPLECVRLLSKIAGTKTDGTESTMKRKGLLLLPVSCLRAAESKKPCSLLRLSFFLLPANPPPIFCCNCIPLLHKAAIHSKPVRESWPSGLESDGLFLPLRRPPDLRFAPDKKSVEQLASQGGAAEFPWFHLFEPCIFITSISCIWERGC